MRSSELRAERALLHLLEADRDRAVDEAALDRLARHEQGAAAGGAVVVDVDDRDAGQTKSVDRALAGGAVAVAIADEGLLDLGVVDAGVFERLGAGLEDHVGVVPVLAAGLLELGHADADHERAVAFGGHRSECSLEIFGR